jgi:hypothetical protein
MKVLALSAVRDTDVFRILRSANSASQDQQLTAVLAERFFEQCPKGRRALTAGRVRRGSRRDAAAERERARSDDAPGIVAI